MSLERAAEEHGLVDQDAEGGFYHSLLPCAQPAVAKRQSLRRGRGGFGAGAPCRHPGDDGFFHAGDDHGVPESSQPSEKVRNDDGEFFHIQRNWKYILISWIRGIKVTVADMLASMSEKPKNGFQPFCLTFIYAPVAKSCFPDTHLTIACVLLETTGQERKS